MTFKYFPHTKSDIQVMLEKIGVENIDDLFQEIPQDVFLKKQLHLPSAHSEPEIRRKLGDMSRQNKQLICFRGAGAYDVYIPAIIPALLSRQEFLTAYTPYQPEISQGTLQYIFEFQSMICELTGMDVSNASVYDGATATAEAMFMAVNHTRKHKVLVSNTLNPQIIEVLKTYAHFRNVSLEFIEERDYQISVTDLKGKLSTDVAAVIVSNPNFFGTVEDYREVARLTKTNNSLLIVHTDPSTLGLVYTPGEIDADIACGDSQTLGIPLSFGGPYIGFIATKKALMRRLPGRIVGMTNDVAGKRGYVLTLQAREQHIRREKATSNICSNQSLMALNNVIYLSLLGKKGLIEVGKVAMANAHYLKEQLLETGLFKDVETGPFFKEFVLRAKTDANKLNDYLLGNGILSGLHLGEKNRKYKNEILFCATELRTKEEMDYFLKKVREFGHV